MGAMPIEIIAGQPAPDHKWYQIWWDVWRHPREETFQALLKERDHGRYRAIAWMFISSFILVIYLILVLVYDIFNTFQDTPSAFISPRTPIITVACSVILFPILGIAGLMLLVGIFHLVAKIFSGYGKWDDLVFCLSAILSPNNILTIFVGLLNALIYKLINTQIISTIISVVLLGYILILVFYALKASENLESSGAVGTIFVPGVVVSLMGLCCSGFFLASLSDL